MQWCRTDDSIQEESSTLGHVHPKGAVSFPLTAPTGMPRGYLFEACRRISTARRRCWRRKGLRKSERRGNWQLRVKLFRWQIWCLLLGAFDEMEELGINAAGGSNVAGQGAPPPAACAPRSPSLRKQLSPLRDEGSSSPTIVLTPVVEAPFDEPIAPLPPLAPSLQPLPEDQPLTEDEEDEDIADVQEVETVASAFDRVPPRPSREWGLVFSLKSYLILLWDLRVRDVGLD